MTNLLIPPTRLDALNLELELHLEPDGTGTVRDKATGRPVQFIGHLSCAKWEFGLNATGNALRITLENVPVIQPFARA